MKNNKGQFIKTHGMYGTRFYKIWVNIKSRCFNEKVEAYKNYGGRGIKLDWDSFEKFRDDMYESYLDHIGKFSEKETEIDRINNDENYNKENCKWSTRKENSNNRRSSHLIVYKGRKQNIKQWAKELNKNYNTLFGRINTYNWSIEKAFNTKAFKGKNQFN